MKSKKTAALMLALLLLFCGCAPQEIPDAPPSQDAPVLSESSTPTKRAEFALAYDDTALLDPLGNTNSLNLMLTGLVYEGLFELDASFAAQPVLCASYTFSENCTIWDFTLRADAAFSDGTPLTPDHVAASLNTARGCALYAARLEQILSVNSDEDSVTITLSAPNGNLPALLDVPVTLPMPEGEPPLGTGDYRFTLQGRDLSLTQNPFRRQEHSLPLRSIRLRAISTSDQRIAAFDAGLVSAVVTDPTASSSLGYSCSYESWAYPTTSMLYLGFNCQSELCADPVLRKAISLYIDRSALTGKFFSNHATPSSLPASPASELYDEALAEQLGYFPDSAAYYLSNGGYRADGNGLLRSPQGKLTELKLLVNTENSYRLELARWLANELKSLGLTVTVTALPWKEFLSALTAGEFDLYLGQAKMTADFDPSPLLTGALNYGLYEDPDTFALLELYRSSVGARRVTTAHTLYRRLAESVPFIPLCFQSAELLTQWGTVSGAAPTQQNPFYQFYQWNLH